MTCATCKHAKPVTAGDIDGGRAIGYFACRFQAGWLYRVECNVARHQVKS